MTNPDTLWQSVQAILREPPKPAQRKPGRPPGTDAAGRIAALLFPGEPHRKRKVIENGLDREIPEDVFRLRYRMATVDKKVCRKIQGKAEAGNSCPETPGTCESCPEWGKKKAG